MKTPRLIKWAAGAALALASVAPAWAQYSRLVVFSDSMSDNHRYGAYSKAATGAVHPAAPFDNGRFCNGLVAVEDLANGLGIPIEDYAFAGATSSYGSLIVVPEGVLTQVNEYLNNNNLIPTITTVPIVSPVLSIALGSGQADPKALHLIWAGPDDYYSGGMNALTAYSATANIQQAITSLYNGGARYFFVPTMPDLSITPSARIHEQQQKGYIASAAKYSAQFSVVLTKGLDSLRAKYPDAHIMSFDTLAYIRVAIEQARASGKNVTDACFPIDVLNPSKVPGVACSQPDNYLFWDNNHPTAEANRILAAEWLKAIIVQP